MIRFPREKIVTEWYEVTPEEFMNYLREVRCYDGKYHFYVSCGIQKGMISWAFELPWKQTNFDLCEFDGYYSNAEFQHEIRQEILNFIKSYKE